MTNEDPSANQPGPQPHFPHHLRKFSPIINTGGASAPYRPPTPQGPLPDPEPCSDPPPDAVPSPIADASPPEPEQASYDVPHSQIPLPAVTTPAVPAAQLPPQPLLQGIMRSRLLYADGKGRWMSGIVGVGGGLALSLSIFALIPRDSLLGKMFDLRKAEAVIPVAIACAFLWGIIYCYHRFRSLKWLAEACSPVIIEKVAGAIAHAGPEAAAQWIAASDPGISPLLRRIQAVLGQWLRTGSLQDVNVILEQHIEHDETAILRNYTLVRLFIWALPVLGLIGTVIGISLAVGGFAHFLGGGIDDVGLIKTNLVSVTSGLSFAFLITLEGLATSLVLMFCASPLQTAEGRIHSKAQHAIVDRILPLLQASGEPHFQSGSAQVPDGGCLQAWQQQLSATASGILEAARSNAEQIQHGFLARLDEHHHQFSHSLDEMAARQRESANLLSDAIRHSIESVVAISTQSRADSSDWLAGLVAHGESLSRMLSEHLASQSIAQRDMAEAFERQTRAISSNGAAMLDLGKSTEASIMLLDRIQASLRLLQAGDIKGEVGHLAETLHRQTKAMETTASNLSHLSQGTERLLQAQRDLQTATTQLRDTNIPQTLAEVRTALEAAAAALQSFRKPFVLQAVEIP